MQAVGIAKTKINVVDLSVLINTGIKGISGVIGITERGEINKPILVGSWLDYVREFGGLLDGKSDFPLLCLRALEAGAKLMISRVGHYTDISDSTTLGGVKAEGTLGVVFQASSIGAWGNNVTIKAVNAISGENNKLDITIDIKGYPSLSQTISNFNNTPSADEISSEFNLKSKYVKIKTPTTETITVGSVTLESGEQDLTAIVNADYIGNIQSSTGIYSFDNEADITRIAIPEKAVPAIDTALANYADSRGDLIAILRTPVGIDGDTAINYREGTGIYSHQPVDTWRAFMFAGDLKISHPLTGVEKNITALGDILGLMSRKDNDYYEWFSFSGPKRGRIKNTLGVVYNFGSNARRTVADKADVRGLNLIIDHPSFNVVSWGNSSLQKKDTLLKHANVADLIIFLTKSLKTIIEGEAFDPNDIETWKNIHRRVVPFLDYIKNNRGIWDYLYQGDQDIDRVEDAVINSSANIDAGQYLFNLLIKPKTTMKYLGVQVAVSNSNVDFNVI